MEGTRYYVRIGQEDQIADGELRLCVDGFPNIGNLEATARELEIVNLDEAYDQRGLLPSVRYVVSYRRGQDGEIHTRILKRGTSDAQAYRPGSDVVHDVREDPYATGLYLATLPLHTQSRPEQCGVDVTLRFMYVLPHHNQ